MSVSAGVRGLAWNYVVRNQDTKVELYIDRGDEEGNVVLFDRIYQQAETIEARFGRPIEWQRLEGKRACRVMHRVEHGGWMDEELWPEAIDKTVTAMTELEAAMREAVGALWAG